MKDVVFNNPYESKELIQKHIETVFREEGWHPKTRKEVEDQVDEHLDATFGWPTVPEYMSKNQKDVQKIMFQHMYKVCLESTTSISDDLIEQAIDRVLANSEGIHNV